MHGSGRSTRWSIAGKLDVGILRDVKRQNDTMQNGLRNEHAKTWVFWEMVKWKLLLLQKTFNDHN